MKIRTLEDFKIEHDFDNLVADIIKNRLKQKTDNLDREKLVKQVKTKVNPEMHRELRKETSKNSRDLLPAPSKRLRFRRTDELSGLVRSILADYHNEREENIDRAQLRRVTTRILVAIEEGVSKISLNWLQKR